MPWITGAKAPRQEVPAALGNSFAVRDHVELASLAQRADKDGLNAPALVLFQNFKDAVTALLAQQAKKKTSPNSTP